MRVRLSIISPAFLLAFSMAFMRDDCSEVALSIRLCHTCDATRYSYMSCGARGAGVWCDVMIRNTYPGDKVVF